MRVISASITLTAAAILMTGPSFSQGQDGTRAERNLQIMETLLPGTYDNANQAYFDRRLKLPEAERHTRKSLIIEPAEMKSAGTAFDVSVGSGPESEDIAQTVRFVFSAEGRRDTVLAKVYSVESGDDGEGLRYLEGCDISWALEAGQYRGVRYGDDCSDEAYPLSQAKSMMLSENAFWVDFEGDETGPYDLERARNFSCYVDVPGVGGGRDIPYKRYEIESIHDKGGLAWITMDDGNEVSIRLQNIRWPMNNEKDAFTRHSFVMYVGKKVDDEEQEVSYTWTIPQAPRIGMNLKWMLANCYMVSNRDVEPYFRSEPMVDLTR